MQERAIAKAKELLEMEEKLIQGGDAVGDKETEGEVTDLRHYPIEAPSSWLFINYTSPDKLLIFTLCQIQKTFPPPSINLMIETLAVPLLHGERWSLVPFEGTDWSTVDTPRWKNVSPWGSSVGCEIILPPQAPWSDVLDLRQQRGGLQYTRQAIHASPRLGNPSLIRWSNSTCSSNPTFSSSLRHNRYIYNASHVYFY